MIRPQTIYLVLAYDNYYPNGENDIVSIHRTQSEAERALHLAQQGVGYPFDNYLIVERELED